MAGKFQSYREWQEEKRNAESAGQEAGGNTRFQTYAQWRQERQTPEERDKYYQASGMDSFRRDFSKYASYDIVKDEANREWEQNIKNQRDYFTRYASHFTKDQLAAFNQELDLYESIVKDRSAYARVQPEIIRAQGQQAQYAKGQQTQQGQRGSAYDETGIRADTQAYKNPKTLSAMAANGDEKASELMRRRYQSLEKEYGNADSGRAQRESREKRMKELDAQLSVVQQNIQNVTRTVTGPLPDTEEGRKTANQLRAWNMQRDRLLAEKQALSKQEDVKTGIYAAQEEADGATRSYMKAAQEFTAAKSQNQAIADGILGMYERDALYQELSEAKRLDEEEAQEKGEIPSYQRFRNVLKKRGMTDEDIEQLSTRFSFTPWSQAVQDAQEKKEAYEQQEKTLRVKAQRQSDAWEYEVAKAYSDKDFAALSKPSKEKMPDGELGEAYYILMAEEPDGNLFEKSNKKFDLYNREVEIGGKKLRAQELRFMDDGEKKLFYYFCNSGNEDMAELWISSMSDALKYRTGEYIAEFNDYPVLRELYSLASSAAKGTENLLYGAGSIFADIDAPDVTADEYAMASLRERNKGTFAGFMVGAAQNIGNMAPSLAGYAVNPALGVSATFLNARGNAYVEAKREGFTHGQAWIYSTLVGASEAGLEKVLGGMGGIAKGAVPEKVLNMFGEPKKLVWKLVRDYGVHASSELIEENLQNYLDPAFAMIAGMTDQYDAPGMEDFIETSVVTAITTLFFSAAKAPAKVRQEKINQAAGRWADAAIRLGEDNQAYNEGVKLRKLLDSGENVSKEQMLAAFERAGDENATKVAKEADVDKIVEKAKAQLKDVKAGWFTWDTAIGDAESVTEVWEQSLMEAYESGDAQEVLKTAASAVKLAESAQINLDNAYKLTRISLDEHEAASREVQYVKDTASAVIENYRNGVWWKITPDAKETEEQKEIKTEQVKIGAQAYIDAGAPEDIAQTAGKVLNGIVSGEITSENITNKQIMELMADTEYGREAIAQTLGVEMKREATKSAMRRAVKRAVAQYENNMELQGAAGEQQEATAQPDITEGGNENAAEGTQSVRRDRGRNDGVGPGEQAGSVGESGSQRTAQRRAEGNGQQNNEKALRQQRQRERIKRFERVTETRPAQEVFNSTKYEGDIAVVPEELYTKQMRDAAQEVEDELGMKVVYFKGTLIREDASRHVRRTAGFFDRERNEIWATVGSELFEPEQLVYHEKYHAFVAEKRADVMQTVDKITEQFDVKELEALVQRYVRAYAGVYDNESVEDIYEELLADAYAGMNRFGGTPNATQYQQAVKENLRRETRENERAMRDARGAPGRKFSISETDDGRAVAVVDSDILSHIDTTIWDNIKKAQAKKAAKTALLAFKDGVQVNGITYKVNKVSRDEYTRSNDTERLYRKEHEIFADKLRASANADDVITATTSLENDGKQTHPRKDNFVDFAHGDVLIQAGDNQYKAKTVVGITDGGEYVFYDVVDMEPTSFKLNEEPSTAATSKNAESAIQESSSGDSVTESDIHVKQKFSFDDEDYLLAVRAGDMDAAQEMVDEAAQKTGYTVKAYHGTNANFNVFRSEKGRYFFSKSEDYAEAMMEERSGQRIVKAYLKMENPYREKLAEGEFSDPSFEKPILDYAEQNGYDSAIIEVDTDNELVADTFYVVFSPEQIKSADPVTYDDNGNLIPLSERFDTGSKDIRYSIEEYGKEWYQKDAGEEAAEMDEEYRELMRENPKPPREGRDLKREIKETLLRGQETKQMPTATVTLTLPESDVYGTATTVTHEYGAGKPFYSRNTTLTPKEAIGYLEAATGMKWQAVPMKKGLWKAEMTTEELDTVFAPKGYSKYVVEMKERGEKPGNAKQYAQEMLAKAWRDPNAPSAATVHPEGVRKADFSASPALEKIGVKIDGSVVDYETTQQIRQAEDARFNIQKTIKSTISRYGATKQEVAHAKSIAEGIDSYFDVPESCRFHVVSELAGLYMDERMAGNNLVSQRKIAIKTALLDKAIEMFPQDKQIQENPDLFHPTKLLTMNYRTPERNMRKIFGDELGGQIYDYYFAPVQANEAERTRWMQKQFDEVRRFRGKDGKLTKLNKAESAYTHEVLDLQSYVEKVDASEKKTEILKAAEKLRRLQDEGKVTKDTRWDLAVEFELDREQSEWMMKYAQWITMKEGKPESVDEEKCMEAAKKYRELFDNYFDAINDFLVSHGGQPIGKIEGYAPHISLNEKVNLLNQTLEKLGFNDNATKLPAEIAGLTEEFRPDKRWTPFFQKRNGSKTDYDIVEGFERYVTYISDVLYHMDDIQKLRAAESYLRMGMGGSFETSIEEAIEESRRPDINDRIDYLIDKGRLEVREREDYTEKEVTEAFDEFIDLLIEEQQTNTRYSDLAQWMQNYTNILAGKQFGGDRGIEHMGGRGLLTLGNRINAVFARANVAGNFSSALNQTAQLPAILSERRASSVAKALGEFTTGKLREFSKQSDYITSKKGVKYVARSAGDMFIEGVFKPVEFVDSMMSTLAVRSAYLDGIKNGMTEAEAMRFADNFGRKIMADRSKGSKPNAFHSKGFVKQMLHMFQIEALNSWQHIANDLPSDFRAIAQDRGKASAARALAGVMVKYLIAAFVLNRWAEETYGGTPAPFDLIGMTSNFIASGNGLSTNEWIRRTINKVTGVDVFEESAAEEKEEFDWGSAIEDTTYNLSNEIPFVSNLSGMLGVGDRTLPTAIPGFVDAVKGIYNALMDGDAFDADTALALVDLLKTAVPGGRQIGKMVSGIRSAFEGGKMNGTGDNERLQYVTNNTLLGVLQQILFGPNATAAAKEHYASGESGLSVPQTMLWKDITEQGGDGNALFAMIQSCRRIENDEDLTTEERGEMRRNEIAASGFTDEQKAYIYSVLFGGADGTSQDEPFEKLMDAGMSWDDITEMFNEYKRIYYIEDINTTEQTTQFQYWLDQQSYTKEQRDIINEEFQYYQYVSSDPEKTMYSKLRAQGVSPDEALRIVENTKAQDGESVKPSDKIDSILKQGMSEEKTYEALGAVLNEGVYGNLEEARAAGISCKTYIDFWQRKQKLTADKDPDDPEKTISGSKKKKVIELIDSLPLSSAQKDVLILQEYPKTDVMEMPWN